MEELAHISFPMNKKGGVLSAQLSILDGFIRDSDHENQLCLPPNVNYAIIFTYIVR